MNLNELIEQIESSMEDIESQLNTAESEANDAQNNASEAEGYAYSAKNDAERAKEAANNANQDLNEMKEQFEELKEQIKHLIDNEEVAGEKPVGLSDMQQDIKKYGDQVRQARANNSKISEADIAKHFHIGEFLVKHILSTNP